MPPSDSARHLPVLADAEDFDEDERSGEHRVKRRRSEFSSVATYGCNTGVTENMRRASKRDMAALSREYDTESLPPFERTVAQCEREGLGTSANPCPHVRCQHHLAVGNATRSGSGSVLLAFGSDDVEDWPRTCVLHEVREHAEPTLQEVGDRLGITRTRAQQIECAALAKLRRGLLALGVTEHDVAGLVSALQTRSKLDPES